MSVLPMLEHCPFEVVNISLMNAPILKDYYWRSLNISGLNETFLHLTRDISRTISLKIPPMPINSPPMKICFHLLNSNTHPMDWGLKRTKFCECVIVRKPLGLSTFRNMFDCPHRDLLTILPMSAQAPARSIFQFTMNVAYGCVGEHVLGYELEIYEYCFCHDENGKHFGCEHASNHVKLYRKKSDNFHRFMIFDGSMKVRSWLCAIMWRPLKEFPIQGTFKLNFRFDFNIYEFDPVKLILTKSLLPTSIYNSKQVTQPIWLHNPYNHELKFRVAAKNLDVTVMEEEILLKSKTTYPILVQFRPTRIDHFELNFILTFMGIKAMFNIEAPSSNIISPILSQQAPSVDFYCSESPYNIYKNYLSVNIGTRETITKMVVLHNHSKDCIQFLWLENVLKGYFQIKVTPNIGTLKPKHSCSCIVKVTSGSNQIDFSGIPITCEIYDFSGSPIDNVEEYSIDSSLDEVHEQSILITRLFVNLHMRCQARTSYDIPVHSPDTLSFNKTQFSTRHFDRGIFDKLFWNFIYDKHFLNDILRKKSGGTYENVTKGIEVSTNFLSEFGIISKSAFIEVLQELAVRSVEEIQQNWRFIPEDLMNTIN